jgi:hypothetical protein
LWRHPPSANRPLERRTPPPGPSIIAPPDSPASPLKIHGGRSNLADGTLLELTPNADLILAGGAGNGYGFS